jgi:LysM repeat protein
LRWRWIERKLGDCIDRKVGIRPAPVLALQMPTLPAPRTAAGVGHGRRPEPRDHRNVVVLAFAGLVALLLAIVVVAATSLSGPDTATSAEQARAAKLSKLPVYWKVHTGDTYVSIARKTGLTVAELERFNPKVNPGAIRPGQRLKLRLKVPKAKPKPLGPRLHTVRTGETYASIARKTGRSVGRLQQLNPKRSAKALQPGDRIRLRK